MTRNALVGFDNQTSAKIFKLVLCLTILLFILFAFLKDGLDCSSTLLLARKFEGEYDEADSNLAKTCLLKKYSTSEINECFGSSLENSDLTVKKRFTFVGSREMKDFYLAFRKQFDDENVSSAYNKTFETLWDNPDLKIQIKYLHHSQPDSTLRKLFNVWHKEKSSGDVVIIGFNPPDRMDEDGKQIEQLIANISAMAFEMDLLAEDVSVFWTIPCFSAEERKLTSRHKYKSHLHYVLKGSHVKVWDMMVVKKSSSGGKSFENDFEFNSQTLLNYLCNEHLERNSSALCCLNKTSEKSLQLKSLFGFIIALLATGSFVALTYVYWENVTNVCEKIFQINCWFRQRSSVEEEENLTTKNLPISESASSNGNEKFKQNYFILFVKCILIFSYFYICDRTNLFEKEAKEFKYTSFYLPLLIACIVALTVRGKSSNSKTLNREMTDEWKGWMQVGILIYHITGASSHMVIYMHIRILVSAYLFMTGFGNFCYYWQGGELTFRRYCQVMLRMNLLTIMLCLVMKKYYQFYYFVPLVSFWYTILFLFLLVPPNQGKKPVEGKMISSNKDYVVMSIKFALFSLVVTLLGLLKNMFDSVFLFPLWKNLFILPGNDDKEWWFRWQLDKYSVIYGAVFGLIYQRLSQSLSSEDLKNKNKFYCYVPILLLIGTASMLSYLILTTICISKQECNIIHPYVVWIPICGYILVRNISENIRGSHSVLMLNAGKISLELFICQYHIWLAADTRGVLVLIPWGYPYLNFIIVTVIFICVAHEVHYITGDVVNLLLPKDNKKIFSNLFFVAVGIFALNTII